MDSGIGFGVDIGGSGIKGARVDLATGELASERVKIHTPRSYDIDEVIQTVLDVVARAEWDGPFGCTFPGIVKRGVLYSAANFGDHWLHLDLQSELSQRSGQRVVVLNDADAAGLAEVDFGAAKDRDGVVIVTTLGTGIGTALFLDGKLVPNTELGHLEIDGADAESRASAAAKEREGLSYKEWAPRLQRYYETLDFLFSPDLLIVGGGISRKSHKFLPLIQGLRCEIVPAALENQAGIAGAAMTAAEG
ncbi:MAG TPA: ROK family protein [Candidatus Nanopelagicales bacterium]